ncbi:MAG TPA: methionyl-tRNA formyltransferase [Gemmatimonadales bacterium]|jgi:methionyl-tRNA formyltransferase|nr:methionyl-tRNA formyltransferase [Gemmatimonadales bacterium]
MRLAAFGRGPVLRDTVRLLHTHGHTIAVLALARENTESTLTPEDWASTAHLLGTQLVVPLSTAALTEALRASGAHLGVSVNWPFRLRLETLAALPGGILNVHGGDLPRYRGNAPFAWAILQGEATAGFTVHLMDEGLDTGPIVLQRQVPILPETHVGDLLRALAATAPEMMVEAVDGLSSGRLVGRAQVGTGLRCYPRRPEDGRIVWSQPAERLERLVRASSEPYAGAFADWCGQRLLVWRAGAVPWPTPALAVPGQVVARDPSRGEASAATGEGLLVLRRVSLTGGAIVPATDLLRSVQTRLHDGVVHSFADPPVA